MATFKDRNYRPVVDKPIVENIPAYLKRFPHWVLWRFDWNHEGRAWAKVPYDAKTLTHAKSDTALTWASFEVAVAALETNANDFDGIGFVFTDQDDLCGIDFDNCVQSGHLDPAKLGYLDLLDSYTEYSVTGTGVHVIARAVSGKGRKDNRTEIEVYDRGRYFAFSGRPFHDPARTIHWRQTQIEQLKEAIFPKPIEIKTATTPIQLTETTDQLLRRAFTAENGDEIFRLYQGRTDGHNDDDSSADIALCNFLAFWSCGYANVLDEMFRGSRLYRDKWDKKHSGDGRTYGQMTVDKAMRECRNFYDPNRYSANVNAVKPDVSGDVPVERRSGQGIYRVSDLREKVHELYQKGRTAGEFPGWQNLAELYTIKRRQFTILTGIPNVGKTPFLDNVIMNLAISRDWKFAVCSLENQPVEDHLSMLLEVHTGEPFSDGPTKRMSLETIDKSLEWFEEHFVFVVPDESNCTIYGLMDLLDEIEGIDGVVVDPWNEFEHRRPAAMNETEYVSQVLSKMRRYARSHNQHWWLVAHPTKLYKDKNGEYPVPTLYDISGSAHFRNKPDMGIVLWRDVLTEGSPLVVYVQKVKYRWCGRLGNCELYYDPVSGRFHEEPVRRSSAYWGSSVVRGADDEEIEII
jgi:hypothetical protein